MLALARDALGLPRPLHLDPFPPDILCDYTVPREILSNAPRQATRPASRAGTQRVGTPGPGAAPPGPRDCRSPPHGGLRSPQAALRRPATLADGPPVETPAA